MEAKELKELLKDNEDAVKAFDGLLSKVNDLESENTTYKASHKMYLNERENNKKKTDEYKSILSELGLKDDSKKEEFLKSFKEKKENNGLQEKEEKKEIEKTNWQETPEYKQLAQELNDVKTNYEKISTDLENERKQKEKAYNREFLRKLFLDEKGEPAYNGIDFVVNTIEKELTKDHKGNPAFVNPEDKDLPYTIEKYKQLLFERPEVKALKKSKMKPGAGTMPTASQNRYSTNEFDEMQKQVREKMLKKQTLGY